MFAAASTSVYQYSTLSDKSQVISIDNMAINMGLMAKTGRMLRIRPVF